jgi:hypothetical protein
LPGGRGGADLEQQAGRAQRHPQAEEGVLEDADALGVRAVEATDYGDGIGHDL